MPALEHIQVLQSASLSQRSGVPKTDSSSLNSLRQTLALDPVYVLTFSTPVGTYYIPVDVYQASRLANKKQARNARALVRFR
jgi:hypothetical protein